ncbi:MAG: dipeptidase [Bacteroidota bacterium]|jgi:acetylornithine deacetylase/succinyl-diaminopimelate desuccinylase-like protein|nr:dipeptidase [Bacteroidota bacterium]
MNDINKYVKTHEKRFLDELFELIRIPSISSLPEHKDDMYRAAEKWKELLLAAGVDKAEVMETDGNPVTYGEKIIDKNAPTVLVYGHMDVMPVDPLELWNSDPFEPVIKDGKIWARGADDDKGQAFMHAKAFEYLVQSGKLTCNVKFLIEGEEEVGSPSLPKFCKKHKKMLQADVILVSDTSMIAPDIPSITTGLRGLAYWQVEVTGPNADLHSGIFGGAVANPINVLSKMIAQTMDDDGRILIPGFYDDVIEVSKKERALMAKAPFCQREYKKSLGIRAVFGEKGYTTNERTGIRPTFDVCGIWGGYTGEGAKTVLPSKAYAKISTRLVPGQDHQKIAKLFVDYFNSIAPKSVRVKVDYLHGGPSYVCPIDLPAYKAAERAFKEVYGKDPVPVRSGGSIPIIATFEEILGIKSVLMGFGLASDAIHSPNENFPLEQFFNGIRTIPLFYKYLPQEMGK